MPDNNITIGKFTEAELEEAIIDLFRQENYAYVNGESIHRQYEDILLTDDLRAYLSDRYLNCRLSIQHLSISEAGKRFAL